VAVSGGLNFASLHAGLGNVTCGITSAGAGYCWGAGASGQLGSGATSFSNSSTPVRVTGSPLWTSMSVGFDHTCGVDTANGVHCWGHNLYGQLGFGLYGDATTPQPVSGGLTFAANSSAPRGASVREH
jgi:alpha-tubulin suppressor-like RCC1 family protein